jgi:hypothetical protein
MMPLPKQQFLSAVGVPLVGGQVYTYAAGTTNKKATFTDAAGTVQQPNPISLNVRGEPDSPIYWSGSYRVDVRDAQGNLVYSVDNFNTDPAGLWTIFTTLLTAAGSSLVGFIQAGAGAVKRLAQDKLRESVSVLDFGAVGDGVADDTDEIIAAAAYARVSNKALRITAGTYLVSKSLDFSGLTVYGDGTEKSVIQATGAQFDVITTTGKTYLRDFSVQGGWDGATAGQSGHAVAATAAAGSYPFNVHLDNLRILNAKKNGVYIERGGYSSINRCKINACGLHAIELYGSGPGNYCTTVHIGGMTTASDCPFGYGLMMTNAQNISTAGVISEYTAGIHTSGSDNRAIALRSYYQENTRGNLFFSTDGSGIGLLVESCFGGGHLMQELPTWESIRLDCNSNFTECSSTANTGRTQTVTSNEVTQAAGFTGSFTMCQITVKPGSWQIFATLQSNTASAPGVGKMTRLAFQVGTDNTASGYAIATNGNFVPCADVIDFQTATDTPARLGSNYIYQNNTGAPVTLYMRVYMASTVGLFATKGQLRAVKL